MTIVEEEIGQRTSTVFDNINMQVMQVHDAISMDMQPQDSQETEKRH